MARFHSLLLLRAIFLAKLTCHKKFAVNWNTYPWLVPISCTVKKTAFFSFSDKSPAMKKMKESAQEQEIVQWE